MYDSLYAEQHSREITIRRKKNRHTHTIRTLYASHFSTLYFRVDLNMNRLQSKFYLKTLENTRKSLRISPNGFILRGSRQRFNKPIKCCTEAGAKWILIFMCVFRVSERSRLATLQQNQGSPTNCEPTYKKNNYPLPQASLLNKESERERERERDSLRRLYANYTHLLRDEILPAFLNLRPDRLSANVSLSLSLSQRQRAETELLQDVRDKRQGGSMWKHILNI